MVIFGIDPGTAVTGYGVIRVAGNTARWVDSGAIVMSASATLAEKLETIYDNLLEKMKTHEPGRVCVEQAFYAKNVHTTLILGHARGVAMLAASKVGALIDEYTPREIKKTLVGNGNATKEQVEYMVKVLLAPPVKHAHADAWDALAVALCGFSHSGMPAAGSRA